MAKKQLSKIVGENIAKQRKKLGFTQEKLAEITDIGQGAISRMENGSVIPKFERLDIIAQALHCEVADLFKKEKGASSKASVKTPAESNSTIIADMLRPLDDKEQQLVLGTVAEMVRLLRR